jgi:hypothetical protein
MERTKSYTIHTSKMDWCKDDKQYMVRGCLDDYNSDDELGKPNNFKTS